MSLKKVWSSFAFAYNFYFMCPQNIFHLSSPFLFHTVCTIAFLLYPLSWSYTCYTSTLSFIPHFSSCFHIRYCPSPKIFSSIQSLIFSDKVIRVEAALLPVWIEGSHRRPSAVHLINQPPLQQGTAETCICSDGACSYTSPIVINRARSSQRGLCSLYWVLCHISKELNSQLHRG